MATTFPPLPGWQEDPYYEKREAFDQAVKIAINAAEAGLLLKANSADLEPVAYSGEYDDLTGKPAPVDLSPYVMTVRRNANGSWPARPAVAETVTVLWADLTELAPADPPGFIPGVDVIIDAGAV